MSQIGRRIKIPANFNEQSFSPGFHTELGQQPDLSVRADVQHEVPEDCHVEIDEPIKSGRKNSMQKLDVFGEIRGIGISLF